jgi:hypothetical protein
MLHIYQCTDEAAREIRPNEHSSFHITRVLTLDDIHVERKMNSKTIFFFEKFDVEAENFFKRLLKRFKALKRFCF